jgi:hypothetical protein
MAWKAWGQSARAVPRLLVAAVLAVGVGAMWAAPMQAAAAKAPRLELVVEPQHPVRGTQAEIVAQVVPSSLGKKGSVSARLYGPGTNGKAIVIQRVQGATPGTFEGLAPVPNLGTYHVNMRYTGGGKVLTASRSFVVVTGSPLSHDLSIAIVVVILGGAWVLMRRRR